MFFMFFLIKHQTFLYKFFKPILNIKKITNDSKKLIKIKVIMYKYVNINKSIILSSKLIIFYIFV